MNDTNGTIGQLSREDMEAAVAYWQPRCLASMQEAERLRAKLKRFEDMARSRRVWKRLRWALKGGVPK